jgi:hypothetical protein
MRLLAKKLDEELNGAYCVQALRRCSDAFLMAHQVWQTRSAKRRMTVSSAPARSAATAGSSPSCAVRARRAIAQSHAEDRQRWSLSQADTLRAERACNRAPVLRRVHLPLAPQQLALPGVPRRGQPAAQAGWRGRRGRRRQRRRPAARAARAHAGAQRRQRARPAERAARGACCALQPAWSFKTQNSSTRCAQAVVSRPRST